MPDPAYPTRAAGAFQAAAAAHRTKPMLPILLACSAGFRAPDAEMVAIEVEPAEITVTTGPRGGPATQFTAWAVYDDLQRLPLEVASWSLSNRSVGTIDDTGLFTPSHEAGGTTWVLAELDGIVGQATMTVIYEDEVGEEAVDPDLFDAPGQPWDWPWTYPEDGVNLPRNTPSITFQWQDPGAEAFRLTFRSEATNLTVYTTANEWTADEATWASIAATNAGGVVEVTLSARAGKDVLVAEPLHVEVNRMDARGTILYWSTSTEGIMQIPYGGSASDYLTAAQTGHCVGCHVVSSQDRLAFTYDGGNGPLGLVRTSDASEVLAYGSGPTGNFKAFSPDGRFLLTTFAGVLSVHDGLDGTHLWDVPLAETATQVDWSPDGTRVALVLTEDHSSDWVFGRGRIAVMDHLGDGTFGEPRVLVDFDDGSSAYYPAWSPDGAWIAFNRSTGDSYDDPDAELWVIDGEGANPPIRLDAANLSDNLTNSWPRWGPLPDDDILWLTFASRRDYGHVASGRPQIWVAAFDPARAAAGVDPSWPAFWLPGQASSDNNHIPVWIE